MTISALKKYSIASNRLKNNIVAGVLPPSRVQKTFTANGNAQITTSVVKYGTGSGAFDGAGDYIRTTNFTDSTWSTKDFTIEWWCRFSILPSSQTGGGGNYMAFMFSETNAGTSIEPYYLIKNGTLEYGVVAQSTSAVYGGFTFPGNVTTNTWYHFAIVRHRGTTTAYLDGQPLTQTGTPIPSDAWLLQQTGRFSLGGWYQTGRGYWNGNIDEVRFSYTARYTGAFTPPTAPFAHDELTMLLLHMDGTNGSTTFTDSTS